MNEQQPPPIGTSVWEHIPTLEMAENLWLHHSVPQSLEYHPGRMVQPSHLIERGFQRLDDLSDAGLLALLLAGRLVDIVAIQGNEPGRRQLWANQSDIARTKQHPVTLVFSLPQETFAALPPDVRRLIMAETLPPSYIGYQALVITENQQWYYRVTDIGKQGIALAQDIEEALRELAGPAGWRPYHPLMGEMLQSGIGHIYHRESSRLEARRKASVSPNVWAAVNQELHDLGTIRTYVEAKKQHIQREDEGSRTRWKEVQAMAQQLLDLYWQVHQRKLNHELNEDRPHGTRIIINVATWSLADDTLYKITNLIRNGAAGGSRWLQPSPNEPPYCQEENVKLQILPQQPDERSVLEPRHPIIEQALAKRPQALKDQDISNLIALLVHWAAAPETTRSEGYIWTEAAAILDYRGLTPNKTRENGRKRRAGHQEENKQALIDSIERLAYLWAIVDVKITGPKSAKVKEGRIIEIKNRWKAVRMQEDGTLKEQVTMWLWRPGDALQGITSKGIFLQQIVQFDHHDEKWELALALLFTFLLGFAAKGTRGAFTIDYTYEIGVDTLLEKGSLMENEEYARLHPKQMLREPFDRAMNRLEAVGIIAHWRYRENTEDLPRKGWLDTWLGFRVQVKIGHLLLDPPGNLKGYRQIIEAKNAQRERREQKAFQKGDNSKQQGKAPR